MAGIQLEKTSTTVGNGSGLEDQLNCSDRQFFLSNKTYRRYAVIGLELQHLQLADRPLGRVASLCMVGRTVGFCTANADNIIVIL